MYGGWRDHPVCLTRPELIMAALGTPLPIPSPGARHSNRRRARAHRRTALVAWTLALGVPAAAAAALWTVGGSGDGQARALTAQNLVVTPGTASAQLFPGGVGDIVYTVSNPNPFPVRVTGVNLGAVTGQGTCIASNFTTSPGTVAPVTIPAGTSGTVTVTGGVVMTLAAGDNCQGVSITVAGSLVASQV